MLACLYEDNSTTVYGQGAKLVYLSNGDLDSKPMDGCGRGKRKAPSLTVQNLVD
jgi:hypothetical protein